MNSTMGLVTAAMAPLFQPPHHHPQQLPQLCPQPQHLLRHSHPGSVDTAGTQWFLSFNHDLQNQRCCFKKKKKGAEEDPRPPRETRNQQGKREIMQSLTKPQPSPSLSHSWLKAMEKNKKRLYFSLCLAENLRHSISALVKTGVTFSPFAENRKGKKKRWYLCVSHSVLRSKQKIKEEIANTSPLLVNVKGTDDKTWKRDQHLMP